MAESVIPVARTPVVSRRMHQRARPTRTRDVQEALVMHAARHYGVRATGITLSEEQAALARRRVVGNGLSERVDIEVRDYG